MNKVFVVQNPDGKEINSATVHGELRVILTGRETLECAMEKLCKHLKHITPNDFLLLIGSPVSVGLAMHLALTFNEGKLKLLIWDREQYRYNIKEINITEYVEYIPLDGSSST